MLMSFIMEHALYAIILVRHAITHKQIIVILVQVIGFQMESTACAHQASMIMDSVLFVKHVLLHVQIVSTVWQAHVRHATLLNFVI